MGPHAKIVDDFITFDDVLLIPQYSDFVPTTADVRTRLTRGIEINIPLVSAPMDTVTEHALAIALAQEGGMGVIHKNLPVEAQAREVEKVKRSENGVIVDPIVLPPHATIGDARRVMREYNVNGIPIVEPTSPDGDIGHRARAFGTPGKLVGILTRRDLKYQEDDTLRLGDVMTRDVVSAPEEISLQDAERLLYRSKVEKLLLTDADGRLAGMITMRDIDKQSQFPQSCKDKRGRLRVGAATGVNDFARIEALIGAEVDVVVVDTAHGHSRNVIETVKQIKRTHDIQVIAGNVATAEGARDLIDAGVDAVKVGIGPGGDLHHADRQRRGRAADQRDHERRQRRRGRRRARHRRRRHPPFRRHHQSPRRRRERVHDGQPVRRPRRIARRNDHSRRPALPRPIAAWGRWARWSTAAKTATARATSNSSASWCPRAWRAACPTAGRWAISCTNWSAACGRAWGTAGPRTSRPSAATPSSAASRPPAWPRATRTTSRSRRKRRTIPSSSTPMGRDERRSNFPVFRRHGEGPPVRWTEHRSGLRSPLPCTHGRGLG